MGLVGWWKWTRTNGINRKQVKITRKKEKFVILPLSILVVCYYAIPCLWLVGPSVSMICGSDGILAKPTNDNGKIANGSLMLWCLAPTRACRCSPPLLSHSITVTSTPCIMHACWHYSSYWEIKTVISKCRSTIILHQLHHIINAPRPQPS
jgi:hypothetical protein